MDGLLKLASHDLGLAQVRAGEDCLTTSQMERMAEGIHEYQDVPHKEVGSCESWIAEGKVVGGSAV